MTFAPISSADGHDAPWLVDELAPNLAAVIDEVIVRCEDAVRQPVVAHELPDVLDRVEFRALGRQRDDVMLAGTVSLPVVCHPA